MIGDNTQCDFEFPFGLLATEIERGKLARPETMPKKIATLDALLPTHFHRSSKGNFTD
jgi:hypothetical protein